MVSCLIVNLISCRAVRNTVEAVCDGGNTPDSDQTYFEAQRISAGFAILLAVKSTCF